MDTPRTKKDTISMIAVELVGATIIGDGNSLTFRDFSDPGNDGWKSKTWELTWPEIWEACEQWARSHEYVR